VYSSARQGEDDEFFESVTFVQLSGYLKTDLPERDADDLVIGVASHALPHPLSP
jgi:hypothetical protein